MSDQKVTGNFPTLERLALAHLRATPAPPPVTLRLTTPVERDVAGRAGDYNHWAVAAVQSCW